MTKEERQLVIEYINTVDAWPLFEQFDEDRRELLIENLFNTLNFKFYALGRTWTNLWKPVIDWIRRNIKIVLVLVLAYTATVAVMLALEIIKEF